ncbi:gaf sensor hybrid histidine kinase [Leptolyngbya sp. Heron Island J]|uniref:GAF domain-containing hybrid sensor histidine kinase/response regulator n=1 Tax=Leptolyngbya sp. Heron Island J TaxID=1385935 RepID=UPI0003B99FB3|nr:GAF domain-containing hybrid sensor histidine kinase/response regulator [Leptolyngbya sp. Heron Island J]ESA36612.1 gaf sensor hybrid histidine kinase [Leptolyngbya sp. Heron Island J]
MVNVSSALEYQSVPHHVFEQIRKNFFCLLSGEISHLSEQDFVKAQLPIEAEITKFTLLSTDKVNLLLLAKPDGECRYLVCLCSNPIVIEQFLSTSWLAKGLHRRSKAVRKQLQQRLQQAAEVSQPLAIEGQALLKFAHQLILEASDLEQFSGAKPLSSAAILQHVVSRLQHAEPLTSLIQLTLNEACEWLGLDRLFIYQVVNPPPRSEHLEHPSDDAEDVSPCITYEARSHSSIESVLYRSDADCFVQAKVHQRYGQKTQKKQYYAIENIAQHYQHHPCMGTQLKQANVGSQLLVPIWLEDTLWGLLIGHHCIDNIDRDDLELADTSEHFRSWQAGEGNFLVQIADLLALAIRQADLQQQLQYQKLMLKAQVEDRTQSLKDALMAAEAANKTKSEFLATMSHELRTPLTYIIGMSATLLRWSFGDLSPRQRDYLNTIHSSGEQLLDIINDILEVAKIEAGRTVLEINDFSLSNLARSSLESFRQEAQAKGVDLRINLRLSGAEDDFRADPRRIRQILANLLSNAVKFTNANGRISLRVWRDPQNVMFQVEDTGIGIPEAQQAVLFETFKQLEAARQRQYSGAGLGLALTKQLVELHNGSIQVVSTPGKGSMFTVRIPLQQPDGIITPGQSIEPTTGRIILLEDDETSASLICDLLTAANYQVIWVIEGSRIVHQVEILQPVAIILNHHLVSGNSHYIVDDLKRYVATSGIKVISLMDAGDMATDGGLSEDMSMDGFDDYLVKPIHPPTLLNKIQSLSIG